MNRSTLALGGILAFVGAVAIARVDGMTRLAGDAAKRTSSPIAVRTHVVTAEACMGSAFDGKVDICHSTGSHIQRLTVSVEACIAGHAGHDADFVAVHIDEC